MNMPQTPNLDAIDDYAELTDMMNAFERLAAYCRHKAAAIMLRQSGHVDLALKREAYCDRLYGQLPEWARW